MIKMEGTKRVLEVGANTRFGGQGSPSEEGDRSLTPDL